MAASRSASPGVKPGTWNSSEVSPTQQRFFFYDGAMSVLQPMIDAGRDRHPVGSERAWTRSVRCAGTARWPSPAWITFLSANLPTKEVHGVLSPYEGLSRGIISSPQGRRLCSGSRNAIVTPARTPRSLPSRRCRPAISIRPCSRTRANWPRPLPGMVDSVMQGKETRINDT